VSVNDQAIIGGVINRNVLEVEVTERQRMLEEAQEVLRRVVEYIKPAITVQRVCDHLVQIIALLAKIMNVMAQAFIPPEYDHTKIDERIQVLTN